MRRGDFEAAKTMLTHAAEIGHGQAAEDLRFAEQREKEARDLARADQRANVLLIVGCFVGSAGYVFLVFRIQKE